MGKIKVALQQRVIPNYRVPFFEKLGQQTEIELSIFSGLARPNEMVSTADDIKNVEFVQTKNIHLLNNSFYFCLQPEIHQWLKDINPDIVIFEANPRYLSTQKAIRRIKNTNKGLIGWGLGVPRHKNVLDRLLAHSRSKFLNKFDALIAYSNQGKQQYIETGINERRVFVAPNSTVTRPVNPPPERKSGFQTEPPILLFVGRLQKRKRIDSLIRICSRLPEAISPELWIVGDGPILQELKEYAQNIYPRTTFWGGQFGEKLEEILKKADLFVMPGTGGLAIQQAMSFGLPVIVAEGDGTQSNMVFPENGWTIMPNNEEVLYSTVVKALSNPLKLIDMGHHAYGTIKDQVNIDVMADVFIKTILFVNRLKNSND